MQLTIRRARHTEASVLTELSLRSKQSNGYDDDFMQACREEMTVTDRQLHESEYWVAVNAIDESICGCASLVADTVNQVGEIHALFIDPNWQRRGVGRALWGKLRERAVAHKLEWLHLDADPFAVPFYTALGFATSGESPSGSIPGRSLPRMSIRVSDIE